MPRTFSTSIQGELDKQFAGEPMIIVEVSWNGDSYVAYSDRKLSGSDYPAPLIISVGKFDTTTIISGGSDSQSVEVVMDDTDGSLRETIDQQDIHLRPVRLYLTFQGLPLSEKALMFEGVINSEIVWNEADRTLAFSVLSKLEDNEAGFTMEDGDFPYVPPSERNKAWPLIFGQVCNMEAVQVTALRKGFLAAGMGVPDPTILARLCQAKKIICPLIDRSFNWIAGQGWVDEVSRCDDAYLSAVEQCIADGQTEEGSWGPFTGFFTDLCITQARKLHPWTACKKFVLRDPECVKRKQQEICTILQEQELQYSYVLNPFTVRNGEDFPQGQEITLKIGEVLFTGVMTGESFLISSTRHPAVDTIDNPPCSTRPPAGWGFRYEDDYDNPADTIPECAAGGQKYTSVITGGSAGSWDYYDSFEKGDFIWLPPGSEVTLSTEADLVHIVSMIPGVIDQVAAYRTFADTTLLTALTTDLYTIHLENYGGFSTVEIWLDSPLSEIEDANWDDELYVSFTSTIGPNPADIITWIAARYTDYTVDAASFAAVKASLTNYPSNFFVKARPGALDLINDIAHQARCAVYIRDNVIYIKYLPLEPSSLRTLTEDDLLSGSFYFDHTSTESLETKHTITWSEGEAGVNKDDETELSFTLKHNIPKYGAFDADHDYATLNIFGLVEKSATFWMIRNANTWRYVTFKTSVKHLDLDVFDCVTLDIAQFPTTKIIIESTNYNADDNTVEFKAWTPIRSGESTPYTWAWPSQQPTSAIFPTVDDGPQESGDGTGITVIPPTDHPLYGGYDPDTAVLATDGDKYPSDLDDSLPTLTCKLATGSEVAADIEPDTEPLEPLAQANFSAKMKDLDAGRGGGSGTDDKEAKGACGQPMEEQFGCEYEVHLTYVTPEAVAHHGLGGGHENCGGCAGPCDCDCAGEVCYGNMFTMCFTFGARFAANFFKASHPGHAGDCNWNCGSTRVYMNSGPYPIPCSDCPGEDDCEYWPDGYGDPDHPAANAGQIAQPDVYSGTPPPEGDWNDWN